MKMTSLYQATINDTVVKAYDEGFPLLMPRWGYVLSAFVLFLIGFFGFFLNLMVILLMFRDRQLWTPLNMILFNLVCSDFSVSVLGNPFTLISALFHRWVFGKTMCVLYGFFMALLGITSITTLTVLSFERYMMVTRPLSSRHLSSKGAILSILFIWSYSLALTTPPLLGWGNYVNEAANISCSVNWHEQSMNTLTYILFLFAMGQILPSLIISFSYINIIRTIKKNSKRMGRVGRAESKVTAMVFVMIVAFTVAWTPYSVFALMEQFATQGIISPGAGVIPALVAKSSICYDPLIYIGMNTQFRQAIKRLFGIHNKGGLSNTEKGYDNTILLQTHRLSRGNELTTRFNSSEGNISTILKNQVVIKNRKAIADDQCEIIINEGDRPSNPNLCTIQEKKMTSDAERSGETFYDEDSSNGKQNLEQKLKLYDGFSDTSPVLTIVDSERWAFSKTRVALKTDSDNDSMENVYGNKAYVDHSSDMTSINVYEMKPEQRGHKRLLNSFSTDLSLIPKATAKRKLSLETKLDALNKPVTKLPKYFDYTGDVESFKTYLCVVNSGVNQEDNIVV